jgi:tryptophan synthase alpha chain
MSDLSRVFENLKKQGDGALIGYVTGGDPEPQLTPRIAEALIKGGVDMLELGVPFSDPIADGPAIQAASVRALAVGTTPKMVLELVREIKKQQNVPVIILTYFNPVFRMGIENFFKLAQNCRLDGVVVPDLPVEEAGDYKKAAEACGVDTIFLAAPSTTNERLEKILACASGFLYVVSHFGVTGERANVENSTIQLVKRVSRQAKGRVPIAVGFGISKPEHVKSIIKAGADGAIVGSAFVNIVSQNIKNPKNMIIELKETARALKEATLH